MEDVEEIVPALCKFPVVVQLSAPVFPSEDRARVRQVFLKLSKDEFEFDATWLTSHFHDLDQLWAKQSQILKPALVKTMRNSFTSAIKFNRPSIWLRKKYRQIDNDIIAAKNKQQKTVKGA